MRSFANWRVGSERQILSAKSRSAPPTLTESEFPEARFQPVQLRRDWLPFAAFVFLLIVAVVVRTWLGRRIIGPWYVVDEFVYADTAEDLADRGLFSDLPSFAYPGLYPHLIAPAWAIFDSAGTPYAATKAFNALLMTLGAVPLYLWARRFLTSSYALLGVGLTLLLPPMVYTGMLVTENAFFPVFLLTLYVTALMLERPTIVRQAAVLLLIAFTSLVRLQGIVLLAIVPTAIALNLLFHWRGHGRSGLSRELRRYVPLAVAFVVFGGGYVAAKIAQGEPLGTGLGSYSGVVETDYSVREVVHWIAMHAAELALLVAIIPASAFVVMFGLALRRGGATTVAERSFIAVSAAAVFWLVVQVGVFASRFAGRIEERNMFHVAPLLFLGFALWLQAGLPRPPRLTPLAAVLPLALLLTVPLESLLNLSLLSDTFTLIPYYKYSLDPRFGLDVVRLPLAAGALGAGVVFAAMSRRYARVAAPLLIAGSLVVTSVWVVRGVSDYARNFRASPGAGNDVSWIDRLAGTDARVAMVYAGGDSDANRTQSLLVNTDFWNRSLSFIYKLAPLPLCCLDQADARLGPGGEVLSDGVRYDYAVAARNVQLAGSRIGETAEYALYRITQPLRIAGRDDGIYADGWTGASATHTQFWMPGNRPGRVKVHLSRTNWDGPDVSGKVRLTVQRGGRRFAQDTTVLHRLEEKVVELPVPKPPFRVDLRVSPTFSPAQFGRGDGRQLGAQVRFEFEPDAA